MAIKLTKDKENTTSLKKIAETLQDLVKANKDQQKRTMPLWVQYTFTLVQLFLMGVGVVGISTLAFPNFLQSTVPDYAIDVTVSPYNVSENYREDIDFEFTFTNVGKKNITNFTIFDITLIRQEGDKLKQYRYLIDKFDDKAEDIDCDAAGYNILEVGKKCVLTAEMNDCEQCFDDKDKNVMFYIYIRSHPPIDNQIVELSIY